MLSECLSILAASTFAAGIVLIRVSLEKVSYISATVFISFFGFLFFTIINFFRLLEYPQVYWNPYGFSLFFIAGIFSPALVRLIYYKGIDCLGVSINASVFAIWPLFASVFSIIVFSKLASLGTYIGGILIIIGVIFLNISLKEEKITRKNTYKDLLLPLLAAIFTASAVILRKMGLNVLPDPLAGVWIGYLAATLVSSILLKISQSARNSLKELKAFKSLFPAGICLALGWIIFFYALQFGDPATVSALINSEALFIILYSKLFLRGLEVVTHRIFFSALIIVIGASVIFIL